jgi:hypothetical protein
MKLTHTILIQAFIDHAGKRALFKDDNTQATVTTETFEKQANSSLSIEPSAIESITFGDITLVKGFYVEVSDACNIRINGSMDPIKLVRASDVTKAKFFIEAEINQITIENLSTEDKLTGVYILWGDPVV